MPPPAGERSLPSGEEPRLIEDPLEAGRVERVPGEGSRTDAGDLASHAGQGVGGQPRRHVHRAGCARRISTYPDLNPALQEFGTIDGQQYFIVADWSFAAPMYRSDKVQPEDTWGVLFDSQYKGRISWWDA